MTIQCGSCGGKTRLEYENRAISLENAGVVRLVGVPYHICADCSTRVYDSQIENRVEELLAGVHCPEGEKVLLWSGSGFVEMDPKRFQLPDYPDRYIKRPKRKIGS